MTDRKRLAETATVSVDDIPAGEREEYLRGLPPARLQWAVFEAADRASASGDWRSFWLMQALVSAGINATATDLKTVRENARADIEYLVPVIVELLEDEHGHGGLNDGRINRTL